MSGIYIHIPFCKQACHYCDFHFSTSLKQKDLYIQALLTEIELQKAYFNTHNKGAVIDTIYMGGGTPSLLLTSDINLIFNALYKNFEISSNCEITIEANPDDLNFDKLNDLKNNTPINRLSVGIQSFFDHDLVFMNRAHNSIEAKNCIKNAQQVGFDNISIDLIYGSPTTTAPQWEQNINTALDMNIQHISAYCLTVEPKTALHAFVAQKKVPSPNEEQAYANFEILSQMLTQKGFIHYEISNFGKNGFFSKHNTSYWQQKPYLGLGASAHSYNGYSVRQWNVANNARYISTLLKEGKVPAEIEQLTNLQQLNEYLMTSLRTMWGINIEVVQQKWGEDLLNNLLTKIKQFEKDDFFCFLEQPKSIALTLKGRFMLDFLLLKLFF